MSKLLYYNLLDEDLFDSINTSGSGFELNLTPPERIINRSLLDTFQVSHSGTLIMAIDLTFSQSFQGFAILGCSESNPTVEFRFKGGLLQSKTPEWRRVRFIDGVQRWDLVFDFASLFGNYCDEIRINFQSIGGVSFVGNVYLAGQVFDLPIEHPINYGFVTTGEKIRTQGGQVFANNPNSYMTAQFSTTKNIPAADIFTSFSGIPFNDINYRQGTHLPLVFVPYDIDGEIIYGTQSKPFSILEVPRPVEDTGLTYQLKFSLEEEL